ncbi:MAG: hypothetical protein IKQ20_11845 [Bacteroidales bacterium]|nr:hypothetical protein [Bacteroidales bacterium]
MKASELMIGDWVRCTDPKPFRIIDIETEWRTPYFSVNGTDRLGVDGGDLQPIPLTGEILEKNGFHRSADNNYEYVYEYRDDDTIICCPKGTGCINAYGYITLHIGCATIEELPTDYVHELQHALRLCGVEIEITI